MAILLSLSSKGNDVYINNQDNFSREGPTAGQHWRDWLAVFKTLAEKTKQPVSSGAMADGLAFLTS